MAGTDAAGELLDRLKVLPTGATPLVRIEPISGVPPVKKFGVGGPDSMSICMRLAGSTVSGALADWLPIAALKREAGRAEDLQRPDREALLRLARRNHDRRRDRRCLGVTAGQRDGLATARGRAR